MSLSGWQMAKVSCLRHPGALRAPAAKGCQKSCKKTLNVPYYKKFSRHLILKNFAIKKGGEI